MLETKKKAFLLFEMVVRTRCPVKLKLAVFAGKNATCSVFNKDDRPSWCW